MGFDKRPSHPGKLRNRQQPVAALLPAHVPVLNDCVFVKVHFSAWKFHLCRPQVAVGPGHPHCLTGSPLSQSGMVANKHQRLAVSRAVLDAESHENLFLSGRDFLTAGAAAATRGGHHIAKANLLLRTSCFHFLLHNFTSLTQAGSGRRRLKLTDSLLQSVESLDVSGPRRLNSVGSFLLNLQLNLQLCDQFLLLLLLLFACLG
mmetsp:Transcript_14035/g.26981  ORF Transcript_14035/g.26981 Transcript_14035/m.26981 type:complete len:204 (+) Transcript_14035:277-888(+)